jgi:hypothetical protein
MVAEQKRNKKISGNKQVDKWIMKENWPVTLWAVTFSMAFKIAVSSFHRRIILGQIPKIFRCKRANMPGLTFMAKDKERKSNALMLKLRKMKWGENSAGRDNFCGSTRKDT